MQTIGKKVAINAALKSGHLIRASVGKVCRVSYKGRDNIVTDVDKKAERIITRTIWAAFPDHSILSEEMGLAERSASYRWVVDPLDGTTNFAHAFPFFSVSIALEYNDRVILGVIYDPLREELFCAEEGKGATLNGRKITVSGITSLTKSFLATGFSYGPTKKDRNVGHFAKLLVKTMAIRRAGSAALDLSYVACGRFDGYWEMDLKPWDAAAGMLIVREAGGKVTQFDGSAYSHYDESLLATNTHIHPAIVRSIHK